MRAPDRRGILLGATAFLAAPAILRARDALAQTYRTTLSGPMTYYIDLYSGSDANSGGTAAPWLTLSYAWNWCQNNLDLNGQQLTFQIANTNSATGLVPGLSVVEKMVGQVAAPIFNGNPVNPWTCVVHTQSHAFTAFRDATFGISNVTIQCDDPSAVGVLSVWGSKIFLKNNFFSTCGFAHMEATKGGYVFSDGPYQIWGSAQNHAVADVGTVFISGGGGATLQIWGQPTFFGAFAFATEPGGLIESHTMVFSGPVGGKRYSGTRGGSIVCGNDPTYFPGNIAGVVDAPGIFS